MCRNSWKDSSLSRIGTGRDDVEETITVCFFKTYFISKRKCIFALLNVVYMKNVVEIPRTQVVMTFISTCIETTARLLNTSYNEVYQRMKRVGLIERFILPHYETLHTESRENLAGVMVECLENWEGKK